jgi:hypothetical protein
LSFDILDDYENTHSREETEMFILQGLLLDGEVQLIKHNIYDLDKPISPDFDLTSFGNTTKLVTLLHRLKNFSEESYIKALRKNLLEIDDLSTAEFISELKDNKTIIANKDVLLKKMRDNQGIYGLLIIMDGVSLLNDKKLFDECYDILKKRRAEFKKSKIWEKSFQDFLKANKLKE